MQEVLDNILNLQQQLAILRSKPGQVPTAAKATTSVNSYLERTRVAIQRSKQLVDGLEEDKYYSIFDEVVVEVLSSSPFTTKTHLCAAFNCNEATIDLWAEENPSFNKAIEQGLIAGEILAREMLTKAAFDSSAGVNTSLLKVLSTNVYDIKDEHNVALKAPDNVSFQVEIVRAGENKNTNTGET